MEDNPKGAEMLKWVLGALGLGAAASVTTAVTVPPPVGWIVAFIILLLVLLFVGGYLLWQQHRRQRASSQFQSSLGQEAAQAPREIKDPKRQAQYTDEVRASFMKGIEVYQSRGKDLYSLPWFVIIGESGSGKTEAIRHSNLDFPVGLNDFMQGAGGTLNMDWWFTNHGVILDTAGKMVFPEAGADRGASPPWQEFLKMLRKHRPNVPINGLLLVLSVDSLIADSASKIAEKAGRIARQLDLIQRTLDVRFPVAVLITKCDKLTGFREFFEQIDDPELQDQILGWSNPEPLDTPFRPDLVDQHLGQVIQRLRKRRLGMLREVLPTGGPRARRADEVDALYALPKSLSLIAPRLRRYLETIFAAGEFSAKPVFLRGIYLTSAMQVGADMDEAVWTALGRAPTEALTVGTSTQDVGRPFFLRHVFLEKVFRERGLVTRATDTKRLLVKRKLTLVGTTSACLVLLLLLGWLGRTKLKSEIGNQSALWVMASQKGWESRPGHWSYWEPVVRAGSALDPFRYRYEGTNVIGKAGKLGDQTLVSFHTNLLALADRELSVSGVFLPAKWFLRRGVSSSTRLDAQRTVFEHGVVLPLIENARVKMKQAPLASGGTNVSPAFHQEAFKALVRLEAEIARGPARLSATNAETVAARYLLPYLHYLTEATNLPLATNLAEVFLRTYRDNWPPRKLRGGEDPEARAALTNGLAVFLTNATKGETDLQNRLKHLQAVADAVSKYRAAEERLWLQPQTTLVPELTVAKKELDDALAEAAKADLLKSRTADSLELSLKQIQTNSANAGANSTREVEEAMAGGLTPLTNAVFQEIRSRLLDFKTGLTSQVALKLAPGVTLSELDADFLRVCDTNGIDRAYARRWGTYTLAAGFRQATVPDGRAMIGTGWGFLTNLQAKARELRAAAGQYTAPCGYAAELHRTGERLLEEGMNHLGLEAVGQYGQCVGQEADTFDRTKDRLTWEALRRFGALITDIESDLAVRSRLPAQYSLLGSLEGRVKASRNALVQQCAFKAEAELTASVGFPILRDAPKTLSTDEFRQLNNTLSQIGGALSAIEKLRPATNAPLATDKVKGRLDKCLKFLPCLVDETNAMRTCTVVVDPAAQSQNVINAYRSLAISEDGTAAGKEVSVKQTYGPFLLSQKLVLSSRTRVKRPDEIQELPVVNRIETKPWGPVRLALDQGKPVEGNPLAWDVAVQVGRASTNTLTLRLLFTHPLPAADQWPSTDNW